jgi:hypothetical protein
MGLGYNTGRLNSELDLYFLIPSSHWLLDEMLASHSIHAQLDRAFVDFSGVELLQKVQLLSLAGYKGCWSLEFRGGRNEYVEVEQDLLAIRRAVKSLSENHTVS